MRRLLAIAILAALPAAAQIHGVPPSVTSITPSRSTPGVPASVTSLGPNGFGGSCCGAGFQSDSGQRHFGPGHHGHHRSLVPVYVPYYYYPYYSAYPTTYTAPASTAEYEAQDEEPPAPTIYERRSRIAYPTASTDKDRYGEHYTDYREEERRRAQAEAQSDEERKAEVERQQDKRAQEEKSRSEEKPADREPATVMVFKDGHHQDVSGYAITGDVLYDLGQGRARKILLADLDLPATLKLNDQLGNDFRLPTPSTKQN